MENDQESTSDRPESSSSGGGQQSSGSNGGSSGSFEQPGPEQRVPQYVDMVIPDYDESSSNQQPQRNPGVPPADVLNANEARMPSEMERAEPQGGGDEEEDEDEDEIDEEDGSLEEGSQEGDSQDTFLNDDASPQQPCIPNENDVLLNSNDEEDDHPGNLRYRAVVRHLAKKYTKVKIGYRRAAVQILVNAVKAQGGRFLKRTHDGLWKEVSNKKAYHKSSHAIRCTCRKVEIVSSSRKRSKNRRRRPKNRLATPQQQQEQNSSESTESTDCYPAETERKSNLEIVALRLQTKDESLKHLSLDLHTVNHDFIFPFAKALDSSNLLSSLQLRLAHMNRTNANALAWGLKRCKGLRQVKLVYGKLSEKSSIVIAGLLENSSVESLNLDENEIGVESLKVICRMISQAKGSKLQRLSLENNPFGDEGATILAKLIASSRHLRYLNLGGNNLQATGVSHIKAAIKKKRSCLFECSGLETIELNRKRAIGESTEDSNEDQAANKKPRANPAGNPSATGSPPMAAQTMVSSSQPSSSFGSMRNQSSSNTSSSNETEMAPNSTGSDNGINNGAGSDDAPTSSMNDSDDAPSSAGN